ncbi:MULTISPECIES: hypothetical protein [Moorena]|nr:MULTISPECIES: hypothetical protein [Moorena]NEP64953.1 hypothetical protein [Moorena sp. SIO3A5]NEQ17864.1 hypothetical protein [Moorena sp. SIO3E2]NEP30359.1 hypothetical protein [Moorena sp. SIO3B2]NER89454.1 hypothetical protein [Moorena sp. SIO3A2]NES40290.1 hypothetical protein [Moorena sp. SIO2C4]
MTALHRSPAPWKQRQLLMGEPPLAALPPQDRTASLRLSCIAIIKAMQRYNPKLGSNPQKRSLINKVINVTAPKLILLNQFRLPSQSSYCLGGAGL